MQHCKVSRGGVYLSKPLVAEYLPQLTGASSASIRVEILDESSSSGVGVGGSGGAGAVAGERRQQLHM